MTTSSYADFYSAAESEGNLNKGGGKAEILPADDYNGVVAYVKYDNQPATGKKFGLRVEISEGPYAGKVVWANVSMNKERPKSATAFFITTEKFGMTKEFFFSTPAPSDADVARRFQGIPVTVRVSHREWNGNTVQDGNIVSVNKTSEIAVAPIAPVIAPPVVQTPPAPAPAFNPLIGQQQAS